MSIPFSHVVTVVQDPETVFEGKAAKLRMVSKSISKKGEDRFFNGIFHGLDKDVALRLAKGDQIFVQGTLELTSYQSKKTGGKVQADEMGYGSRILRVIKSPSFFEGSKAPAPDEQPATELAFDPGGPGPLDGIL